MNDFLLKPIGTVRNSVATPEAVPYNGAPSTLELDVAYADAALGLQPGFIWVTTWLHAANRLHARESGGRRRGSFASRTPVRLNPVALTAARLLRIEGRNLHVDALDVCDGTPLLDVKPYVRDFDSVCGRADPAWRRAPEPDQRLARLARTVERFCGPLTPPLALAARLALAADRDLGIAANSADLHWECHCSLHVAAGIQAVSGAPLNSPRLILAPDEARLRVWLRSSEVVEYRLLAVAADAGEVLRAPEDQLFRRTP